ncbi:hypothetical protein GCM10010495_49920 [Kitasatospora herbaricolor]|uniref:hypothetical protein n=1 Tax=Kitasatospora herbaricolor TaxID=68217 RepID=UPI001748B694|nr:hypothetical protein [Kitasatospora herbaricolor]MDQ0310934.1 hypothetical protein [Kitasatospora herbaricolor]GGV27855.1 hypothetical protein GCM10010495_49920 [Kitasatospora herbaricolor]
MPEQKPAEAAEKGGKRIDLSMAQVVASALATMVGALLASELGVAGTVIGAAVVSVAATTSTAVFHHIFRRTGDQLRVAADRGPGAGAAASPSAGPSAGTGEPAITSDWNSSKVLRARPRRSWRSALVLPGLVFLLAMVPIVAFELVTGQPVSATVQGGTGQGTSFGGSVHGTPSTKPSSSPSPGSASSGASQGAGAGASSSPSAGPSAAPSKEPSSAPSAGQPSGPAGRPSAGASPSTGSSPAGPASPSGQVSPEPAAPAPGGAATAPGDTPAAP